MQCIEPKHHALVVQQQDMRAFNPTFDLQTRAAIVNEQAAAQQLTTLGGAGWQCRRPYFYYAQSS